MPILLGISINTIKKISLVASEGIIIGRNEITTTIMNIIIIIGIKEDKENKDKE